MKRRQFVQLLGLATVVFSVEGSRGITKEVWKMRSVETLKSLDSDTSCLLRGLAVSPDEKEGIFWTVHRVANNMSQRQARAMMEDIENHIRQSVGRSVRIEWGKQVRYVPGMAAPTCARRMT